MENKYRKTIFCDWQFIENYLADNLAKTIDQDHLDDLLPYIYIKNCILNSGVQLYLNLNKEQYISQCNAIEKKRKKAAKKGDDVVLSTVENIIFEMDLQQQNGELNVSCIGEHFEEIVKLRSLERNYLDSIYFSCESGSECQRIMSDLGIIAIGPSNAKDFCSYILDSGVAINRKFIGDWNMILQGKIPSCNSMILVDNYILSELNHIEENLGKIFENILPNKLNSEIEFHLTLITLLQKTYTSQKRFDKIVSLIKTIRPELRFSLTIIFCLNSEFHDRTILTNNSFITCGAGFNLFKDKKITKSTSVSITTPYLNLSAGWSPDAVINFISDVKRVWKNKSQFKAEDIPHFLGDGVNRLIEEE